jgi:methyl-accepting chemotaxis protein
LAQVYLFQDIHKAQLQAEQLLEQDKKRGYLLNNSAKTISKNMKGIRTSSEGNNESIKEMSIAFNEIATGMTSQTESVTIITDSVENTRQMAGQMMTSIQTLLRKAEEADQTSLEGSQTVEKLPQGQESMAKDFPLLRKRYESYQIKRAR